MDGFLAEPDFGQERDPIEEYFEAVKRSWAEMER